MKYYIVYNTTTGEISSNVIAESQEYLSPIADNLTYLEVANPIDNGKYYLDPQSQQTVAFPDKPDQYYTWNWTTKTWQDARTDEQKNTQAIKQVQDKRIQLLTSSDWVVIKAMDQGTQVPEAWRTYRQQLRDITQQPGYPLTVTWPEPPQ
jgi:hypothetical protein